MRVQKTFQRPLQLPRLISWISVFWTAVFWILCILVPLVFVFSLLSQSHSWKLISDPQVLSVVYCTWIQAVLSTLISCGLGLFLGLSVGEYSFRHPKSRLQALLTVPLGVPTVVVAISWVSWLGR